MIRVLVAEDEPPTMRRIVRMIEQADPAFTVVATALDGEQALDRLSESPCDVVFTDIRMPVMDGLRLMDEMHARYPDCLIVVLSGHQDFAYVSHAIRVGAMDYLLKPVAEDALKALLARLKERYRQVSHEKLLKSLSAHINKSTAYAEQDADSDVKLGICLFCAGAMPLADDAEMYPGADVWNLLSPEKLALAHVPDFATFTWEFMGNTPVERILVFETESEQLETWARYLHEVILSETTLPVSLVCCTQTVPISETGKLLKRLRRLLERRNIIGRSLFLTLNPNEEPGENDVDHFSDNELAKKLSEHLRSGKMSAASTYRRELFLGFKREQWTQLRIYSLLQSAFVHWEGEGRPGDSLRVAQYRDVLLDAIGSSLSLKELENRISSIDPPENEDNSGEISARRDIVFAIEKYLRTHYAEHITNQTLSQAFGYVPSYISILFRQEFGMSPSDYLTKVRLDRAKSLMQEKPDRLIRDIAELVGFKSQHHFSKIFKKNEGMWPTSFQS